MWVESIVCNISVVFLRHSVVHLGTKINWLCLGDQNITGHGHSMTKCTKIPFLWFVSMISLVCIEGFYPYFSH